MNSFRQSSGKGVASVATMARFNLALLSSQRFWFQIWITALASEGCPLLIVASAERAEPDL
jgi:hypothetical protein